MYCIGDIVRLNAKRYPDKKALIMEDKIFTHDQLNKDINKLAHGLLSIGIGVGDRVAILSFNCPECVMINFAVAKCGAIVVPINYNYKQDELIYVVNNSNPKILFYGPEFVDLLESVTDEFSSSLELVAIGNETIPRNRAISQLMEGMSIQDPDVKIDPETALTITYTSGTTGSPKGVLASHTAFLNIYQGMVIEGDVGTDEVVMVALPLFHTAGMHALISPALLRGGTVLIMVGSFDPDRILREVAHHRVTMTMWVPTQLAMLVNYAEAKKHDVSSLKKIWYGSSPISQTIFSSAKSLFKADFYQWYGQTETGMISILRPEDHDKYDQCTGREIYNSDLRIVNEKRKDVAVGEIGEIISSQRSKGMLSYHNMVEKTAETIIDGYIYTGDLAKNEGNGYFTIVDRMKDMIISGAENIYPKEIENVIMGHPGILEVAVFGIPDEIYGESVCAAVVTKEGYALTQKDIIQFCVERLSSYKKPKKVIFQKELPKNPSGKVTKNVLRKPFWEDKKNRI